MTALSIMNGKDAKYDPKIRTPPPVLGQGGSEGVMIEYPNERLTNRE